MTIQDYLPEAQERAQIAAEKLNQREELRFARVQFFLTETFSEAAKLEKTAASAIANKQPLYVELRDTRRCDSFSNFLGAVKEVFLSSGSAGVTPEDIQSNKAYQNYADKLSACGHPVQNIEINTHTEFRGPSYRVAKLSLQHD